MFRNSTLVNPNPYALLTNLIICSVISLIKNAFKLTKLAERVCLLIYDNLGITNVLWFRNRLTLAPFLKQLFRSATVTPLVRARSKLTTL
jgi:hypothetical protein